MSNISHCYSKNSNSNSTSSSKSDRWNSRNNCSGNRNIHSRKSRDHLLSI